jgi:hypothetical protein
MPSSALAAERVRSRFRTRTKAVDDLHEDERLLVRPLRPTLLRRRQLAAEPVSESPYLTASLTGDLARDGSENWYSERVPCATSESIPPRRGWTWLEP